MKIEDFGVEQWMNTWETKCTYNVAETCVYSLSLNELFELCGTDPQEFYGAISSRRFTYGDIEGSPAFLEGVAKLYRTVEPGHIIPTHGATGANSLVLTTLIAPGTAPVAPGAPARADRGGCGTSSSMFSTASSASRALRNPPCPTKYITPSR